MGFLNTKTKSDLIATMEWYDNLTPEQQKELCLAMFKKIEEVYKVSSSLEQIKEFHGVGLEIKKALET